LEDIRIAHQTSLGLSVFLPKENGVKEIAALISQFLCKAIVIRHR